MAHFSPQTTEKYAQLWAEALQRAALIADKLFKRRKFNLVIK